jgi:intergrase/recombinase
MRFGDLREYYATVMTKWLTPAEIDFLQGRVSGSVFMRHYFNPALIADLKERTFKGLSQIQAALNG